MVEEQLPELEHVETRLTEREVKKASNFNNEWDLCVYLSDCHTNIVVVLKHWASLFENRESIWKLETRTCQVDDKKHKQESNMSIVFEIVATIEFLLLKVTCSLCIKFEIRWNGCHPETIEKTVEEHEPMNQKFSLLLSGNLGTRIIDFVIILIITKVVQEVLSGWAAHVQIWGLHSF